MTYWHYVRYLMIWIHSFVSNVYEVLGIHAAFCRLFNLEFRGLFVQRMALNPIIVNFEKCWLCLPLNTSIVRYMYFAVLQIKEDLKKLNAKGEDISNFQFVRAASCSVSLTNYMQSDKIMNCIISRVYFQYCYLAPEIYSCNNFQTYIKDRYLKYSL